MLDNAPTDKPVLIDFKTCEDASPDACIRAVTSYGYDLQAAHYLDVWRAATGEYRGFIFIFQEKTPPYEASVVELYAGDDPDADWMHDAHQKAAEARRIWGECLRSGVWPGYPRQIALVGAPSWHKQKWADRSVIAARPDPEIIKRAAEWQAPQKGNAA